MLGHLPDLLDAVAVPGLRLVAEHVPRLDAGEDRTEPVLREPLEPRLRQQGEAAFRDELDRPRGDGFLDGPEHVVEPDAEVGVVPADDRSLHLRGEKAEVVPHLVEVERLVGDDRIDAEAARVRAPQTAEHGDDLEQRRLLERRVDELPAGPHAGQRDRLRLRSHEAAERPLGPAVVQDVVQHRPVGETEHIVEVLLCVLGIAARVRSADAGDGALAAEHLADRVGELGSLGEGADEEQIDVLRKFLDEILEAGVAYEADVVPGLFAPHAENLRHDACEVRVHDLGVQSLGGALGDQVHDAYAKLAQMAILSRMGTRAAGSRGAPESGKLGMRRTLRQSEPDE